MSAHPHPGKRSGRETSQARRTSARFVLELARALHAHGTPAHELERVLLQVASRLGLRAEFFSTPTSIMVGFGELPDQEVRLLRVEPGRPNLGHLATLGDITRAVLHEDLSAVVGLKRIQALFAEPPRWPGWLRVIAYVLSSASVACFLRLHVGDVVVASALGILTASIVLAGGRIPTLTHVTEPLAAFIVTTLALMADVIMRSGAGYLTSLAGLVVLLPGLTLTLALTELSTRHLASGTARLSGALVVFLGLGFGIALGAKLGTELGVWLRGATFWISPGELATMPLPVWAEWAALLIAPLAFTVLLDANPRDAAWIMITCIAAYLVSRYTSPRMGEELGGFLSAFIVSAGSNLLGKYLRKPPIVTLVPGLLILVPGSIGFRSVTSMVGQEVDIGVAAAFRVAIVGISLAAGILAGNVVTRPGSAQRRPG